jgi:hypothetical protein
MSLAAEYPLLNVFRRGYRMRLDTTFALPYRPSALHLGAASRRSEPPQCSRWSFGQDTFDAEVGAQGTRYFSRVIHWPTGSSSGVTIGAGYDMGRRSSELVFRELRRAGVPTEDALFVSKAAGLRGEAARRFVEVNRHHAPTITPQAQQRLFAEIVSPAMIDDVKRILVKADTVRAYGALSWDALPTAARELLFDLRYRGDYIPATRRLLHPALVAGDFRGVVRLMEDRQLWRRFGVPEGRIDTRIRIARRLLGPVECVVQ